MLQPVNKTKKHGKESRVASKETNVATAPRASRWVTNKNTTVRFEESHLIEDALEAKDSGSEVNDSSETASESKDRLEEFPLVAVVDVAAPAAED